MTMTTTPIKNPAAEDVAEEKAKKLLAKLKDLSRLNLRFYVVTVLDSTIDDHPEPEEIVEYLESSGLSVQDWNYFIAQASILK
jgi:cephalosporin hydroxylase